MPLDLVHRAHPRLLGRDQPRDGVPPGVAQVEDLVLGAGVVRTAQDALPVLEVEPRLVRGCAGEGREAGEEPGARSEGQGRACRVEGRRGGDALEEDAPQAPVVDRVAVALAPERLDRHVVGRADDAVGVARIGHPDRLVQRLHLERRAQDERRVGDRVELRAVECCRVESAVGEGKERASVRKKRTLSLRCSILPGLSAPAASPKSVSLMWPVVSMRKFCRRAHQKSARLESVPNEGRTSGLRSR